MSKEIVQRVVSMQFDNKNFEQNVQTSLNTLDKLKQSLKLDGVAKGLENVEIAANKLDFNPLTKGIETVKIKFSALEVMAVTALANITNSAVNTGKKITSALTIEPIKTGFEEYETQINAVQTILANTSHQGTNLEQVNAALDELNTYADKTIYNFTEMTKNIGTFTAAGIDLRTSVNSIKGIANLAAVSGSTSQQASTAMYQLSQALAAGKVSLMDWNSVVNAGMGGKVFQDALIRTSELLGTGAKEAIKTQGSFRESLTKTGWLTTEVLTETLKQFAGAYNEADLINQGFTKEQAKSIAKMASTSEDAATKVKTFTQLWDTLKESAQSGWTQSWEIIIGDFEEAKKLWTEVSDYFGNAIVNTGNARNEVLQGWADGGGREMAIEALKNAFNGLLSVIKPIKEAFQEVFPPVTSEQLLKITEIIKNLTSQLKLNDTQAEQLKSTFKGLFSILYILITALKEIIGETVKLLGNFTGLGGSVLEITALIGNYISRLRDSVKETNVLGNVVNKIVNFLQNVIDKIKEFIGYVNEKFQAPGFKGFLSLMQGIWNVTEKIGNKISELFSSVTGTLSKVTANIGNLLSSTFKNGDMSAGLDLINGGIFAAVLIEMKKFVISLGDTKSLLDKILGNVNKNIGNIKGILDSVKNCLQSWQQSLKAGILLKIASAIGILAISLTLLSTLNSEKLNTALRAITVLFVDLMSAMAVFDKMGGTYKNTVKATTYMIGMSTAVLILASALKKIAELDFTQLTKGIIGIGTLTVIITASAKAMAKDTGKVMSGALNIVIFASAIKILASACKELSTLKWEELGKGLSGVGVLMSLVSVFLNDTKFSNNVISNATGIIVLAAAIKILASACSNFAQMSWEEIGKGLVSIGALLTELTLFTNLSGNAQNVISTGIALIAIASAVKIFASAVKDFSGLSWEEIAKGLVGMAASLIAVTAAINFMPKNMVGIGVGLTAVSAALLILSNALGSMGGMNWKEIAKGLTALGGSMLILVIGLNAMNRTLAGSAALLIASAALAVLAPVLLSLGSMSWEEIGKGLLTIAGAFTVIGVAGLLLTPIIPAILGLGAAFALLGVGMLGIGAGLILVSTGITALSVSGVAGAAAFVTSMTVIITGLIGLIPAIAAAIGNAIITIVMVIGNSADTICQAATQIILALCDTIIKCSPTIIKTVMTLLVQLLEAISENIGKIVTLVIDTIIAVLEAIAKKIPDIIQAGIDIVIALIDGLAQGITNNTERLKNSFLNLFKAILKSILSFFGIHSPSKVFLDIAKNLIQGLIDGIKEMTKNAILSVIDLCVQLVKSIGDKAKDFLTKGKELMNNLKTGISNKLSEVKTTAKDVITGAINGIKEKLSEFKTLGSNMMNGLKDGISNATKSVTDKVKGVATSAVDAAKKILKIHSPSKVFMEIGSYIPKGLVKGIDKFGDTVKSSISSMADTAISTASEAITDISDCINSDMNTEPVIRPVINMDSAKISDLQFGANINTLFSEPINSLSQLMLDSKNAINDSNNKVISAIDNLREDFNTWYSSENQEIALYVDSKKLATSLSKSMNRQLNILSQRGAY